VETQLTQLSIKLLRVRLAQQWPLLSEQVDVERGSREVRRREALQPLLNLGL